MQNNHARAESLAVELPEHPPEDDVLVVVGGKVGGLHRKPKLSDHRVAFETRAGEDAGIGGELVLLPGAIFWRPEPDAVPLFVVHDDVQEAVLVPID